MKLVLSLGMGPRRSALLLALAAGALFHAQPVRPVLVAGRSMEPTYHSGELILGVSYWGQAVSPGDLVVLRTSSGRMIKRVSYVGGQQVKQVFYDQWTDDLTPVMVWYGEMHSAFRTIRVPEGHVYVRGDNASDSLDSRQMGTFPVGKIEFVVLSPRKQPGEPGQVAYR